MATTWKALEPLLRTPDAEPLPAEVVDQVRLVAAATNRTERTQTLTALATALRRAPYAVVLLIRFARSENAFAQRLALEMIARIPPLDAELRAAVQPLLASKDFASSLKIAAAAALLRAIGNQPRAAQDMLRLFSQGMSRSRALEKLLALQKRIAGSDVLNELIDRLEAQ